MTRLASMGSSQRLHSRRGSRKGVRDAAELWRTRRCRVCWPGRLIYPRNRAISRIARRTLIAKTAARAGGWRTRWTRPRSRRTARAIFTCCHPALPRRQVSCPQDASAAHDHESRRGVRSRADDGATIARRPQDKRRDPFACPRSLADRLTPGRRLPDLQRGAGGKRPGVRGAARSGARRADARQAECGLLAMMLLLDARRDARLARSWSRSRIRTTGSGRGRPPDGRRCRAGRWLRRGPYVVAAIAHARRCVPCDWPQMPRCTSFPD